MGRGPVGRELPASKATPRNLRYYFLAVSSELRKEGTFTGGKTNYRFRPFAEVRLRVLDDGSWRKTAVPVVDERQWNCKRRTCYPHSNHRTIQFRYNQGENTDIFGTEIDADLADSGSRARLVPSIDRGFASSIKVAIPTT